MPPVARPRAALLERSRWCSGNVFADVLVTRGGEFMRVAVEDHLAVRKQQKCHGNFAALALRNAFHMTGLPCKWMTGDDEGVLYSVSHGQGAGLLTMGPPDEPVDARAGCY